MVSCINMPDNINTAMINSVKETIKSSTIWNKLVKTIENANINMEKLIQDSVDYGIEIGMFHQNKCGKIECKETKRVSNGQTNDKFIFPLQQKNTRNDDISQMNTRSAPKSDSETTLSAYSSSKSIITRTRKSAVEKELKRSSDTLSETDNKRMKNDTSNHFSANENQKNRTNEQKVSKPHKIKPINKKMVKPIPICAFCLGDELINKRTKRQENMITCWDCGTCAHPTCLQWPDSLYQKVRTIRWQCLQCKRCAYCGMISKKDDDMLLCDVCDQGFHIYCCDPPIKVPPKGEWVCRLCRPITGRKERPSIFLSEEYEFVEDCQIVTPETVGKMCNLSNKQCNVSSKSEKNNSKIKSTLPKKSKKVNLLQLKKKKLVNKAVQRQRQALTDGLSKFFTPSNKRQSRVSKQSISSDSLFDRDSKKSPSIGSPKDKGSSRSIISSTRSKSPITADANDEFGNQFSTPDKVSAKTPRDKKTSNKKHPEISIYHSPNRANTNGNIKSQIIKTKLKKYQIKKFKLKKTKMNPVDEISTYRGPGRPKKIMSTDKCSSIADATESSSVTVSKNDLSTNYSMLSAENCEADPYPISDIDRMWYTDIQQKVVELLPPPVDAAPHLQPLHKLSCRSRNEHSEPPELSIETSHNGDGDRLSHTSNVDGSSQRFPPRIQIGRYIIDTWYSAPYPSEYARLNVLYICEYCLKPIKSYDVYVMHMEKCTSYFPPGNEIYRNGDLSVFEVDGYVSKLYCQQLCLLAKLFLDHKTLYYDVEPFLFYVAVLSKNKSSHIIGYFSKEKRSTHKYNLSCIMVLPPYQKYNYGRFLIDFSYLLSRKEGQCGSPEKPLSTLGRISYESYWKSKILPFILNKEDVSVGFYARGRIYKPSKGLAVTIDRMSTDTGISPHDVANTIQLLSKKVDLDNSDRISIQFDWEKLKSEAEKFAGRYPKWIPIDEECLRWVPLINPNEKSNYFMKSPTNVMNASSRDIDPNSEVSDKNQTKTTPIDNTKSSNVVSVRSPLPEKSNPSAKNSNNIAVSTKISKKSRETVKNNKKSKVIHKTKVKPTVKEDSNNISKPPKKKETKSEREEIITRNKSVKQNSSNSSMEEISPVKVDLTKESSENSDIPDNEDCNDLSITAPLTRSKDLLIHKKPVFEMFKDATKSQKCNLSLSPPKESPPINRNDPSPVSTVSNEILCPVLISPEIDEENEEETDIGPLINDKRRLILRLEKWDANVVGKESPKIDTIELSNDSINESERSSPVIQVQDRNVFMAMENGSDRIMEVVIADRHKSDNQSPITSSPIVSLAVSDDHLESNVSGSSLEPSKSGEFVLPATIKDSIIIDDIDKPPTLSRISSLEDNVSNQLDDYSSSFNLPADISQNEEFKSFYNDGNVFNSITTSQTDSSDKDADESLLSVSNSNGYGISDPELNGTYSCDSSISYNLRPRIKIAKLEDLFENPLRCSPGQSDLVQNHVSSTTPFVSPPLTEKKPLLTVTETNSSTTSTFTGAITTASNSSTDSMKFDITFEDVGIVDVANVVVTRQRLSEENLLRARGDAKQDSSDKVANPHTKSSHSESKEEFLEIKSSEQLAEFHIDIVSSSLNETTTISDSSL